MWKILTDLKQFTAWNPFITHAEGEIKEGARLSVHIEPPGGTAMTFKPTVTCAAPGRELRWLGRLFLPGIFDGEHSFEMSPAGQGRTHFVQREKFSGFLSGIGAALAGSMANKSNIVIDLRGWRTPSVSGEELQALGKSGPRYTAEITRGLPVPRG